MQSRQQHRQLCVSHGRIDFTPEAAKQQTRRTRAGIKHVAMRVLLVSENRARFRTRKRRIFGGDPVRTGREPGTVVAAFHLLADFRVEVRPGARDGPVVQRRIQNDTACKRHASVIVFVILPLHVGLDVATIAGGM